MKRGVTVLAIALLIALVWVSGCNSLWLGSQRVSDFNTTDSKQASNSTTDFMQNIITTVTLTHEQPITIQPTVCTINATAVRYALGLGKTTPEIPKLGWGDYVLISGGMNDCAAPVSLKIKGIGLPSQGVLLQANNDDITSYPVKQNGPFSIRWGTEQLGGKSWKNYPTTKAIYTGTFVDKDGNEYFPIQLDFTNPPACVISATMDLQNSLDPAINDVSWTHSVIIQGVEDYCTSGLKFKLAKKSDLEDHAGTSPWIYDHGIDIGTAPPSSSGFSFVWKPYPIKEGNNLPDGNYVLFIMNAAGTEYTKVGFYIGTNPGEIVPQTTTPQPIVPTTTIPPSTGCSSGMTACNGICKNLLTDAGNCGMCFNQCTIGMICAGGKCACPSGQSLCKNGCADTQTSNDNCGSCGTTCIYGQFCQNGKCICPTGKTLCGISYIDTLTDKNNCGSCSHACAAASFCSGGKCCSKVPAGGMPPTYKTVCE